LSKRQARFFVSIVASLLILGVVTAELPELLSLIDDTTNDFVVRKAGHGETQTLTAPSHSDLRSEIAPFAWDGRDEGATSAVVAPLTLTELFLLHSVLRR
jgi:hypothetical protein